MRCITLAYVGLVWLRTLDQLRTNGWQLSWPDEQNGAKFICRRWANKNTDKMPVLAQQMIAIWAVSVITFRVNGTNRVVLGFHHNCTLANQESKCH